MRTEEIKIVMIEDDEGHARLIEKNLRRAGISNEITHINNGKKAIEFFDHGEITDKTLVLLDLNLPEISGYEILKHAKNNDKTRYVPIIVLTTTDNQKEIDLCYELGCNVYITKPVEYENFCGAIQKLGLLLSIVKVPNGN